MEHFLYFDQFPQIGPFPTFFGTSCSQLLQTYNFFKNSFCPTFPAQMWPHDEMQHIYVILIKSVSETQRRCLTIQAFVLVVFFFYSLFIISFPDWLISLGITLGALLLVGTVFCCLKTGNGCNGTEVLPQFILLIKQSGGNEFTVVY